MVLLLGSSRGFLTKNSLRNIVVSKAVVSSVVENISLELFDNTVLMHHISNFDYTHPYCIIYFAGFFWYKFLKISDSPTLEIDSIGQNSDITTVGTNFRRPDDIQKEGCGRTKSGRIRLDENLTRPQKVDVDKKLVVFDYYVSARRFTRQLLFILFYLLSKNVGNAY
ncbi:MAG: hypothetical protein EBS95_11610 [Chitinophagia bacterium]|nr:hypothetical protein [Chitinophagia bacterium]